MFTKIEIERGDKAMDTEKEKEKEAKFVRCQEKE